MLTRLVSKKWVKWLLILISLGMMVAGVFVWRFANAISQPLEFGADPYVIPRGTNLNRIAEDLKSKEIISETLNLRLLAKYKNLGHNIKAGEYQFPEDMNLETFLDWISKGKGQIGIKVTIIEGWTFRQMREQLAKAEKLKQETQNWTDEQIMAALGQPELHPEGQFFPDTYHYLAGESDLALLKKSFNIMQQKLQEVWQQRGPDLQLKTSYEALIMASIIEKESQANEEIGQISGVFNNRLKVGMRLQTDPTVIYGAGDDYKGDITYKHLRTDTPYNTYTRDGLPPTPISLPGDHALLAAVQPEETEAYYFVAKGGENTDKSECKAKE